MDSKPEPDLALPWEQLLISDRPNSEQLDYAQVALVKQKLWEKYTTFVQSEWRLPAREEEPREQDQPRQESPAAEPPAGRDALIDEMKIKYFVIGERPTDGYPLYICLHGGGGTHSFVNDSQWKDMQGYYRNSVSVGVYVAPRGITDTWNLHFVEKSYELYDKLIAYMIACWSIDPNRVYLLGFSAGGDGVYHIAPKMADRWAGANMSSGHPNGVRVVNLYHVPFLIQVGEHDSAYSRNKVGTEYGVKLRELRMEHLDGYVSECWLHKDKGHNFRDNDQDQTEYLVVSDLNAWLKNSNDPRAGSLKRNTNAVTWLNQHQRNPLPTHLIWDVSTRVKQRKPLHAFNSVNSPANLFYWIDISGAGSDDAAKRIEATVIRDSNMIIIKNDPECGSWIRLLLGHQMVDVERVLVVEIGEERFTVHLRPSLATMTRTLLERGDPNFMFESEVILSKAASGKWEVSGTLVGK